MVGSVLLDGCAKGRQGLGKHWEWQLCSIDQNDLRTCTAVHWLPKPPPSPYSPFPTSQISENMATIALSLWKNWSPLPSHTPNPFQKLHQSKQDLHYLILRACTLPFRKKSILPSASPKIQGNRAVLWSLPGSHQSSCFAATSPHAHQWLVLLRQLQSLESLWTAFRGSQSSRTSNIIDTSGDFITARTSQAGICKS